MGTSLNIKSEENTKKKCVDICKRAEDTEFEISFCEKMPPEEWNKEEYFWDNKNNYSWN